ncbi:MAG: PAS domain-containing protein [Deltaproteobacteria bacterium]|nr:PAS domain-containing protein [Candidatus Zymogenaceae bacterium]
MLPFREIVLLVEDDVEFARLIRTMIHERRGEQIEVIHVRNIAEALDIVSSIIPDIILTDIIPDTGSDAHTIEILQNSAPGAPVIVLSSWEYENVAIQALKQGAQDYLFKKDITPDILIRSIAYALERTRMQEGLMLSEERLRAQYAGIPVPTFTFRIDPEDFTLINFNHAADKIIGETDGADIGTSALLLFKEKNEIIHLMHQCARDRENKKSELEYTDKNTGKTRFFSVSCSFLPRNLVMVCIEDITEKRIAQELLQRAHDELEAEVVRRTKELKRQDRLLKKETKERDRIERELAATTGELRVILDNVSESIVYFDTDLRIQWANRAAAELTGVPEGKMIGKECHKLFKERKAVRDACPVTAALSGKKECVGEIESSDGRKWRVKAVPVIDDAGKVDGVIEIRSDITADRHKE